MLLKVNMFLDYCCWILLIFSEKSFAKTNLRLEYQIKQKEYIYIIRLIGLAGRVFANDPADLGSIPGCIIPKTFKMLLDTSLLNTQQYKVRIKGKVKQSWEKISALPNTLV